MANKKDLVENLGDLIIKLHEVSSEYVELFPSNRVERMKEVFSAVCYLSGEISVYLLMAGMDEKSLKEVELISRMDGQRGLEATMNLLTSLPEERD